MVHVVASLRPITHTLPVVHKPVRPTTTTTTATDTSTDSGAADFRSLFTPKISPTPWTGNPTFLNPPTTPAPTAESVFGANPWVANPTGIGPNGQVYGYNPFYFATPETAAKVAQMLGGTVVPSNQFTGDGGAFCQQQPNLMVKLPNGALINAGLVASFYTHGYPQSYVDQMVANEVKYTT